MFCQRCGIELSEEAAFCLKCGHKLQTDAKSQIPNWALWVMAIAAAISLGTVAISFLPRNDSTGAQGAPTTDVASASPSVTPRITPTPWSSPSPKPTQLSRPTPELTPRPQRPRPEPASDYAHQTTYKSPDDYPYRHRPTPEFPNEGATFSLYHSSNQMLFRWSLAPSSEVARYRVRIERKLALGLAWKYWIVDVDANQNWYARRFADTGTYRWNITPMFPDGSLGMPTEWRTFRFTQ